MTLLQALEARHTELLNCRTMEPEALIRELVLLERMMEIEQQKEESDEL